MVRRFQNAVVATTGKNVVSPLGDNLGRGSFQKSLVSSGGSRRRIVPMGLPRGELFRDLWRTNTPETKMVRGRGDVAPPAGPDQVTGAKAARAEERAAALDALRNARLVGIAASWAWAMDTPFKWVKQVASHFGGTAQGMAMSWPGHINDLANAPFHPPSPGLALPRARIRRLSSAPPPTRTRRAASSCPARTEGGVLPGRHFRRGSGPCLRPAGTRRAPGDEGRGFTERALSDNPRLFALSPRRRSCAIRSTTKLRNKVDDEAAQ
jgi:hypothetical protein